MGGHPRIVRPPRVGAEVEAEEAVILALLPALCDALHRVSVPGIDVGEPLEELHDQRLPQVVGGFAWIQVFGLPRADDVDRAFGLADPAGRAEIGAPVVARASGAEERTG